MPRTSVCGGRILFRTRAHENKCICATRRSTYAPRGGVHVRHEEEYICATRSTYAPRGGVHMRHEEEYMCATRRNTSSPHDSDFHPTTVNLHSYTFTFCRETTPHPPPPPPTPPTPCLYNSLYRGRLESADCLQIQIFFFFAKKFLFAVKSVFRQ